MRKPRDYSADLKALNDKARQIQERKVRELGQLVIATGTDAISVEQLAGALLAAASNADPATKEEWRKRGARFFQNSRCKAGAGDGSDACGAVPDKGGAASHGGSSSAA
ncbi:MAG: conjugal transfer protein TraD [Novosphingobium sp.]|nr:conjugal transfer protein TraD [Novosphingobium sp.]